MDVNCSLTWPDSVEGKQAKEEGKMIMPGDTHTMLVTLSMECAINEGLRFTVREGGKTVGTGVVIKIVK
jgi:elongation factor Tu